MKFLEVRHLKKSFHELQVLHDISYSVNEGEVVAVIGPSGSGKSTLLRCCTMLERMDSGTLIYLGETAVDDGYVDGLARYAKPEELKKIQGYFGLVFQNFNLFPHYSVIKNIMDAPIHVQKRDKKEVRETAEELIKKMGLEGKENYYPCQLSGGQQQRGLLARALCATRKLLLLDEPVSGLDPKVTAEMYQLIQKLNKDEGITIIMISHDISAALQYASHILHIGNSYFFGTKEEYLQSEICKNFIAVKGGN